MPTFALNFSRPGRPGRRPVLQLPAPRHGRLSRGPGRLPRHRPVAGGRDRAPRAVHARLEGRGDPRFRLPARQKTLPTASSTSPTRSGPGAGRFRPTRCRRRSRTCRCCASSSATASAVTWRGCSSTTWRRRCSALLARRLTGARRRRGWAFTIELAARSRPACARRRELVEVVEGHEHLLLRPAAVLLGLGPSTSRSARVSGGCRTSAARGGGRARRSARSCRRRAE